MHAWTHRSCKSAILNLKSRESDWAEAESRSQNRKLRRLEARHSDPKPNTVSRHSQGHRSPCTLGIAVPTQPAVIEYVVRKHLQAGRC